MCHLFLLAACAILHGYVMAENSYIILIPKVIRPGLQENITVNLFHYNPSYPSSNVVASLEYTNLNIKNRTITSTQGNFKPRVPGTLQLEIPRTLNESKYKIRVKSVEGINFTDVAEVNVAYQNLSLFIQTDKAIYKAGQTVNMRVFGLFPNGSVYSGKIDIFTKDPKGNLVKQWLGLQNPTYGVISASLIMDDKPLLGSWTITAKAIGITTTKQVEVSEYVLPKYKVTMDLPSYVLINDKELTGTISAKYTFGEPARAEVVLKVTTDSSYSYKPWKNDNYSLPMFEKTIHIHGEEKFTIPLTQLYRYALDYTPIIEHLSGNHITVTADVTEDLNKKTQTVSKTSVFRSNSLQIKFVSDHNYKYMRGLSQSFQVKITEGDQPPVGNFLPLRLQIFHKNTSTSPGEVKLITNSTFNVPPTGVVEFGTDFPDSTDISEVRLKVNYGKLEETLDLSPYADQYMHIQLKVLSTNHQVGDIAKIQLKTTKPIFNAFYQVTSQGFLLDTGTLDVKTNTTFVFSLPLSHEMTPEVSVLVYNLDFTGEIIADHIAFPVNGFLRNKVALHFNKTQAEPGEQISLTAQADPHSMICLLAEDQSVLQLKSGNDLSTGQVIGTMKSYRPNANSNLYFYHPSNGHYGSIIGHEKFYPAYSFDEAATLILTDAKRYDKAFSTYHSYYASYNPYLQRSARQQCICPDGGIGMMPTAAPGFTYPPAMFYPTTPLQPSTDEFGNPIGKPMPGQQGTPTAQPEALMQPTIRTKFPETWLWINRTVGSDGQVTVTSTVPDTITSWTASAFAINPVSGLGIADTKAEVRVFRDFFITLNLPFSVIRGEELVLQANVFNYLETKVTVLVTLEKSDDFKNIVVDDTGYTQYISDTRTEIIEIEPGDAETVYFPIVASSIGKIDISVKAQSSIAADGLKRQLRVEAEGTPKEYTIQSIVDLSNSSTYTDEMSISFPSSVVDGSQRVQVFAIGDFMGPSIKGLDKLLKLPYGCGEQTMVNFAPDVFITDYLEATGQLTNKVKNKALTYMEKGYQRELTYQHYDGSFSSFGSSDRYGSMWLTAFVLKSFHQAKNHIFIDQNLYGRALQWIYRYQLSDGSFEEPGTTHSSYLKGGDSSKVFLTSFVVISLSQLDDYGIVYNGKTKADVLNFAGGFLQTRIVHINDPYTMAICSYALSLMKNSLADLTMTRLKRLAISEGDVLYWNTSHAQYNTWTPPARQASANDIETAAYALLYHTHTKDYAAGWPILRWILKQRNTDGGFSSTQDTVLSLQAMSEFARFGLGQAGNRNLSLNINVLTDNNTHTFMINEQNTMVLQSFEQDPPPKKISLSATGHGIGLVEVAVQFNVHSELIAPMFSVRVDVTSVSLSSFSIQTCSRYFGTTASGMSIIEQGIPSGFEANIDSIKSIYFLKKTEIEDRKVILYFDEIGTQDVCVTMTAERVSMVAQTQPVPVRVYDYYNPDHQVTTFFQIPSLRNSTYCDVCSSCTCTRYKNLWNTKTNINLGVLR